MTHVPTSGDFKGKAIFFQPLNVEDLNHSKIDYPVKKVIYLEHRYKKSSVCKIFHVWNFTQTGYHKFLGSSMFPRVDMESCRLMLISLCMRIHHAFLCSFSHLQNISA